ncbi:hypothetical protein HMPREF1145_0394 [Oribacterium parvum ACB8]|nr:hypothetical protein HMPREF1145_0394 [Oribacterium parvum ACB8]
MLLQDTHYYVADFVLSYVMEMELCSSIALFFVLYRNRKSVYRVFCQF